MDKSTSSIDILIVDDVPDNLRLLSRMLVRRGYNISTAKSGPEAIAALENTMAELILLDVNMPGMDGYDVCRHIKKDDRLKEIPVIFLSALSEPSDKLRGFESGGVDYVTKPFHFHEVIARVETHLELYRQKQENRILRENERSKFEQITYLKDQVLDTATHDLKNPLTSIKLSVTLLNKLLERSDDEKVFRYLTKIEFDTNRMLQLINELLDLASVDINASAEDKPVHVDHFIRRTINDLYDSQKAGVQIKIVASEPHLTAVFDARQIGRVLQNLLVNLIKFTPEDDVAVMGYKVHKDKLIIWGELEEGVSELVPEGKELNHINLGFALLKVIMEEQGGEIRRQHDNQVAFEMIFPFRVPPDDSALVDDAEPVHPAPSTA